VSRSDFYRAALLTSKEAFPVQGVTGRLVQENPLDLDLPPAVRLNNQVMVGLNGLQVQKGDILQAVRWERRIREHGYVLSAMGLLQVTRLVGDSARATVVDLFHDYRVGDPVIPAEEYLLDAAARPNEVDGGMVGTLVDFVVPQTVIKPGGTVFIDLGTGVGVQVGDEFAAFSSDERDPAGALVEDRLCTVRVVRVSATTATGRIVEVVDPGTRPGAPVRRVRRMPTGAAG
jgi:hypothetical protein